MKLRCFSQCKMVHSAKIVLTDNRWHNFRKSLHLRCLAGFWICLWIHITERHNFDEVPKGVKSRPTFFHCTNRSMSKISIGYIRRGEEGIGIFSMTKRYHLPFTARNIFSDSGDVGGGETNRAHHQKIDETLLSKFSKSHSFASWGFTFSSN